MGARKKVFLKITMVLAILLVAFGLFYVYWSFHTDITITYVTRTRALDADSRGEYHQERFMTVFSNPFNIPTAKPLKDCLCSDKELSQLNIISWQLVVHTLKNCPE